MKQTQKEAKKAITSGDYALVHVATFQQVMNGEKVVDFRDNSATVTGGAPPHKPSSTGRVYVLQDGRSAEYYPGGYNLRWVPIGNVTPKETEVVIQKDWDGEFRVPAPQGNEDHAYYTHDLEDAVGTAREMWADRWITVTVRPVEIHHG